MCMYVCYRWTKFITQASEAQKKIEMGLKKKPAEEQLHNVSEKQMDNATK